MLIFANFCNRIHVFSHFALFHFYILTQNKGRISRPIHLGRTRNYLKSHYIRQSFPPCLFKKKFISPRRKSKKVLIFSSAELTIILPLMFEV